MKTQKDRYYSSNWAPRDEVESLLDSLYNETGNRPHTPTFFKVFPQFVLSEEEKETFRKVTDRIAHISTIEASEKLVLVPNWVKAFGSYGNAMRALGQKSDKLFDLFSLAIPYEKKVRMNVERKDLILRHPSTDQLYKDANIPQIGNFFLLGVNFRLWRRKESGKKMLGSLLPGEIPAGIADVASLTLLSPHHLRNSEAWYGIGATGDQIVLENGEIGGGVFQECGGQITETTFRFKSLDKPIKSHISFFAPERITFNEGRTPKGEFVEKPENWTEAVDWLKQEHSYFQ